MKARGLKVPRPCTVCTHPDRPGIDQRLLAGEPNRRIAAQCAVTEQALRRHKADHVPARLARAAEAKEVASAGSLLEQMRALQEKTLAILEAATDQRTALAAVAQVRGNVQLLAELTGMLATQPTVQIAVVEVPPRACGRDSRGPASPERQTRG